jgi:predicted alpha/beta hydrolase family esterase
MSRVASSEPLHLLIPGIDGSGPDHWQSLWATERAGFELVDLGSWPLPDREQWIAALDMAIDRARLTPIVLVAHSLGCLLVTWWAARFPDKAGNIRGAMLVAPCDVERPYDRRLERYAPMPASPLPFPALVVASTNDPYASIARSTELATRLDADLFELGPLGHINAQSRLGRWDQGLRLLDLVRKETGRIPAAAPEKHCDGARRHRI